MCIGNRDGGDDAIGPYIADKFKSDQIDNIEIIDCGIVPENYTSVVKSKKPDNLIIIDSVEMGLEPGEIRIVPKEKIGVMTISTHGIPISVIIGYLEQYVKNIIFIGIQPKEMLGEISNSVKKSGDILVKILKEGKLKTIKILK
ncbi:MAG: hydrogenase maturation peptidase HycI [Thermoplasmatales archaeon]|nr:MAG: hydrogenase maturation peptidase HycI [Thermoplasmatales archaeon]